jgi:hypothetical protein
MTKQPTEADVLAGQAVYTPTTLRFYDALVGVNCAVFWGCPRSVLLNLYRRNAAREHLDIGVGTGYLPDRCGLPGEAPRITLLDLNPHCLASASKRLARYQVATRRGSVLEPFPVAKHSHGSAALNLMLHCVPGDIPYKAVAFDNAAACVRPGGRIFGSTVLSRGVPVSRRARVFLRMLNGRGGFNNADDSLEDLHSELGRRFPDYQVTVHGCTALFEATVE